mgnify:CR=1 FL=1
MISAKAYDKYLQYFLFFQMISLSITVLLGVCFRWAGHSLVWYDEIAGIQLAWITYFGSAYASLKGLHIGMPTLIKVFPKDIRKILFVLSKLSKRKLLFLFKEQEPLTHSANEYFIGLYSLSHVPVSSLQLILIVLNTALDLGTLSQVFLSP